MKVVFVADNLITQSAGIHVYTRQFIKRTIAQYPQHSYHHITSAPYDIEGSTNEVMPIKNWMPGHYRMRYFREIPKRIKHVGADVAIEMAHFGPFRLPSNIKRVTVVHDLTPILYPEHHDKPSVWWHKNHFGKLLRSVDAIISNSNTTLSDIVTHLNVEPSKINACYPEVPTSRVRARETRGNGLINLLTVGTVEPRKNHLFILEALTQWYEEYRREFTWVVAGAKGWKSKPFYDALKSSSIEDKVRLTGYVDDHELTSLYRNSNAFLFASHYEGFGLPILEAMSSGLCVILSDTKIHREVGGDGCRYVQTHKDLIAELNKLSQQPQCNHDNQLEYLKNASFEVPFL